MQNIWENTDIKGSIVYEKDGACVLNTDNLFMLRAMKDASVDLIYCDVLYNTGKVFNTYDDRLGTPQEAVEWYRPRILEMRRVLKSTGVIFLHCNWRMDSYLRVLLDEIFGVENFRQRIYRRHTIGRETVNNWGSAVDTILFYSRGEEYTFNLPDTEYIFVPLVEKGYMQGFMFPYKGYSPMTKGMHWLIPLKELKNIDIEYDKGVPCTRKRVAGDNLWLDMEDDFSKLVDYAYDTPKSEKVLEKIIATCTNKGEVVCDFFMGGGVTPVVASRLGREVYACDISAKACEVTINKLKNQTETK